MTIIAPPSILSNVDDEPSNITHIPRSYKPNPTEIDAAEKYKTYKTSIRFYDNGHVPTYEAGPDGTMYRFATLVRIVPYTERFTIYLSEGATQYDLDRAESVVRDVQAGKMLRYPWRVEDSVQQPGEKYYDLVLGFATTPEAFAQLGRWNNKTIVRCTDPDCINDIHPIDLTDPEDEPFHIAEQIDHPSYTVRASRYGSAAWEIDANVADTLAPAQAASLASDLMWVTETAKRLNSKEAAN